MRPTDELRSLLQWRTMAAALLAIVSLTTLPASAQSVQDLKRLSLEDLMNVQVTTLSRTPEPTFTLPASVFVLTRDDIRRSGATSLPQALRLVPGLQVARIGGGTWAIGTRGFADRLARSMLVLIDGRAVYSPLFAGTYWEVQDVLLEDIDRIEVIRGPGGTLWGANAVNGIINIITRAASETRGVYVQAGAGTQDHAIGAVQYGGGTSRMQYRVYGKGIDRAPEYHARGPAYDDWRVGQAGFRADWTLDGQRNVTLQGDLYRGSLGERPVVTSYLPPYTTITTLDAPLSGANLLARYTAHDGHGAEFQLQTYYDRTNRDELPVGENRDTVDVDLQQSWHKTSHQIVTGAEYRLSSGRIIAVAPTAFTPADRTDSLVTAFVQDEMTLTPVWRLTGGVKLEHNAYSGFEVQPAVRLTLTPDQRQTATLSVTRAVRTPSRVETDYTTISQLDAIPSFVRLEPNPEFQSEKLIAYEAGYRVRPAARVSLAIATFFNQLDDVLSTDIMGIFNENVPPAPPRRIFAVTFANTLHGSSAGGEISADVRPLSWWRWTTNYSYVRIALTRDPGSRDVSQERRNEGQTPRHQFVTQSSFDLPRQVELDWIFRYISELPGAAVPAYGTWDARVGWRATPHVELAVVGQDLQDARHLEWPGGAEIRRSGSILATLRW